ncbi:MAG: DCC1-like thiol-disulfide oxidoreductase family protein [Steroidobacteraceae bacterium]
MTEPDATDRHPAYSYREDPSVPAFPDDRPIIIFDGYCVLCSRFARFVLKHDRRAVFRLMAAQSPLGQALYRHLGLDPVQFETNVLLEQGRAWFKFDATSRICRHLRFPWSLVRVLGWLPGPLLDRVYDWVARNRLRWFGSRTVCLLTDQAYPERFLR